MNPDSPPRSLTGELVAKGFVPFAFGASTNLRRLDPAPFGHALTMIDAEDPANLPFHDLMLRLNQHAYGGLGMPAWVQLDCALLPSAFVGWALPGHALPEELRASLAAPSDDTLVPVAEALAVPKATPEHWVTWSLCSVMRGHDLGFRAKLLALAAFRCTRATGIVQLDNPALRIHTRFGPLRLLSTWVPYHTRPEMTALYRLELPVSRLASLDRGETVALPEVERWLPTADHEARRQMDVALRSGDETWWLLHPGLALHRGRPCHPLSSWLI